MSSKHVFDSPQGLVVKSLRGAVALNPSLRLHASSKTVYRAAPIDQEPQASTDPHKVTLISGGGAGHEPAHAGYTGRGMLSASVSGDVFASPSAKQIVTAITLGLFGEDGRGDEREKREALVIINNYTGDRLNFGLAIEKARALIPNLDIRSVVVSDDVSLLRAPNPSLIGPRGLGGNIFVCKVLGALAERGAPVDVVKRVGDAVVARFGSIGVGLDHCHVPGRVVSKAKDEEDGSLGQDECEIGMGLHNEPGARKIKMMGAETLIQDMLEAIFTSRDENGGFCEYGKDDDGADDMVLYINNLGGISQLEISAVVDETLNQLESKRIHPLRVYCSSYMTSLNAPGFSISLLNLSGVYRDLASSGETPVESELDILQLLDDPTEATAWAGVRQGWGITSRSQSLDPAVKRAGRRDRKAEENDVDLLVDSLNYLLSSDAIDTQPEESNGADWYRQADVSPIRVKRGIEKACEQVLAVEADMTRFDTIVGDGDCGETFAAGARAVTRAMEEGSLDVASLDPPQLSRKLGEILEENMGGTIGALFALYFTSLSTSLSDSASWSTAPLSALSSLSSYTPARPGDRTVIDALHPFCSVLSTTQSLGDAVSAAKEGAEGTRGMKARLGRAVYVGGAESAEGSRSGAGDLPPDPGAWGVAAILEGLWLGFNE
ncbi:Dak1-domain-containing protein [Gloeophyllum trabeum ATCC 11539]|uniref:Dak1-domain-containing protein n=1 Tax=Gloeophyllum trabeum (strain ATCC 11539 / FP-39264 / Madison 617) TaxID=670483 RepID=S7PT04_GLOTA|nr:Dak1-domain-containing protein [Gloeophyllum trabeum ATCC 11539]EPQ50477.1 Dak1-domain-containing protein [Gloeophyllum trabeum ATCC 11539]